MAGNGPGGGFDLPDAVLAVLPSDPFEQLDVARKITSIALASRVSKLESEAARLRQALAESDDLVAELQARVEASDAALAALSQQISRADQEKEKLLNENASLANTVKKLNRDVSKLEVFKKTLMQSLSEEEEGTQGGGPQVLPKQISGVASFSSGLPIGEEDAAPPPLKKSSSLTQISETGSSVSEDVSYGDSDASKQGTEHGLRLPSYNTTPRLTPPGSPPRGSAAVSSTKLSRPLSPPRRHSIAFSTTRNMFDERSSVYSSMPSSNRNTMTSPFDTGAQAGRARVDGKEFFRQVRSRLSYEQFSAFLANVKELNSHKQTREETLQKAEEIFGADNKDLYAIFEGLISRNLH